MTKKNGGWEDWKKKSGGGEGWNNGWSEWKGGSSGGGWNSSGWNSTEHPATNSSPGATNVTTLDRIGGLTGENSAEIVVKGVNSKDSYLAAKCWDDLKLSKEVLDGIYEMGYNRPSKIQEVALPITSLKHNLIGQAQNGSGKTAAFSIAILMSCSASRKTPQAICLSPTRELARQNNDVIGKLGKYTGLTRYVAIPQGEGNRPPRYIEDQIIVATPGKLHHLLKKRIIDNTNINIFVIDEADVMISEENKMGSEVFCIRKLLPEKLQILLFSATWPESVREFAVKLVPNATKIEVKKEDLTLETITQMYINVGRDENKKVEMLSDLYAAMNIGQSIIFVNSRKQAFELAKRMRGEEHAVSLICGTQKTGPEKIDTSYRDKVMDEFRRGVTKVLISTDVLSRGIDVPAVTLVINYELPVEFQNRRMPETETYMHRIGRTGRFGLRGIAISLVTDNEMPMLETIKKHYKCEMENLPDDVDELELRLKKLRE